MLQKMVVLDLLMPVDSQKSIIQVAESDLGTYIDFTKWYFCRDLPWFWISTSSMV